MDINVKPTIAQMNETIGIFMGGKWKTVEIAKGISQKRFYYADGLFNFVKDTVNLDYHQDWRDLMPVVEKICKIRLLMPDGTPSPEITDTCHPITWGMPSLDGRNVLVRFRGFSCWEAETLLEAAYLACYEVTEFENNNKQDGKTTGASGIQDSSTDGAKA